MLAFSDDRRVPVVGPRLMVSKNELSRRPARLARQIELLPKPPGALKPMLVGEMAGVTVSQTNGVAVWIISTEAARSSSSLFAARAQLRNEHSMRRLASRAREAPLSGTNLYYMILCYS